MITAIGQGILFGIALCFSIGPAFFGLIQTSLKHGYRNGVAMALGIFASDLTYLLLAYFGISSILMNEKYAIPVGFGGGIILVVYGLIQMLKKPVVQNEDGEIIDIKKTTYTASALKGFIMNLLNPFVLFLWIGAITLASNKLDKDPLNVIVFFIATLSTVLGTDILKSLVAGKIKNYLNDKTIWKVNMIAGIILIISGIILIIRVVIEHPWIT